ncbi:MAG TPA: helix-turn-helix transcriptional regulator [Saprospiraceae bacterium]|nr:helix-turn-helix transcriptional regulator [Saprospiraceae bacterium]
MYFNNSSVQQIKDELQYWWTHQDFSDNSIKSLPIHLVDNNVLKALAQNTNTVVQIYDMSGFKSIYTSPNCKAICGFTSEELNNKGFLYWISTVPMKEMMFYIKSSKFVNEQAKSEKTDQKHFLNQVVNMSYKNKAGEKRKMITTNICLETTPEGKQKYQLIMWQDMSPQSKSDDFIARYRFSENEIYTYFSTTGKFENRDILTDREHEVINLTAQGLTSKDIASQLFLSAFTIDNHKKNVMQKFQVGNMIDVISICRFLNVL